MTNGAVHLKITGGACTTAGRWNNRFTFLGLGLQGACSRRLIGQCAWYALRAQITTNILRQLLTANGSIIRIIEFGSFLDDSEVQIGYNLRTDSISAYQWRDDVHDTAHIGTFNPVREVETLITNTELIFVLISRQQASSLINNGDMFRFKIRHAGRHQVHNAGQLGFIQYAAAIEIDDNRGCWVGTFTYENRLLGHSQVNTGTRNTLQRGDRTRQFPFQGTLMNRHFLHATGTETLLFFQQLKTRICHLGQSLAGKPQACVIQFVTGYHD